MSNVRVFRVVRPVATVRFQAEPYPELTREFEPIANTYYTTQHSDYMLDGTLDGGTPTVSDGSGSHTSIPGFD